ncbi:MAG TPA: tRNA pseudouridine(38-40) synthase TruA [Paenibacillaceae bacterium]
MRNICLLVSYDGTRYHGFQTQPDGNTIQDRLEEAIRKLTGESVRVVGSGRTDAGVHARGQVANFHTSSRIPAERWALALNSRLPEDIVVLAAAEVDPSFHARRDAVSKTYRYTVNTRRFPDVFRRRYEYHHPIPLDCAAMREGLRHLVGEHDFTSFASAHSTASHHVRTIFSARLIVEPDGGPDGGSGLERGNGSDCGGGSDRGTGPDSGAGETGGDSRPPGGSDGGTAGGSGVGKAVGAAGGASPERVRGLIHLELTGNGFLYNMVRIIAGTLLGVGEGKRPPEQIAEILAAKDRSLAGPTAPAHGLVLWRVDYDARWGLPWQQE